MPGAGFTGPAGAAATASPSVGGAGARPASVEVARRRKSRAMQVSWKEPQSPSFSWEATRTSAPSRYQSFPPMRSLPATAAILSMPQR